MIFFKWAPPLKISLNWLLNRIHFGDGGAGGEVKKSPAMTTLFHLVCIFLGLVQFTFAI